nr:MAG TPA: hypothetical protein [Caudoviricetes sp.]
MKLQAIKPSIGSAPYAWAISGTRVGSLALIRLPIVGWLSARTSAICLRDCPPVASRTHCLNVCM